MGLFSKDSGKTTTKAPAKEMTVERADQWMLKLIQTNEHSRALEGLLNDMNDMPNLLPKKAGESPDHLKERKISAIAMAIHATHEKHGPKTLINEQDMQQAFSLINAELVMMDINKETAPRQAAVIDQAATRKIEKRGNAAAPAQTGQTVTRPALNIAPRSESNEPSMAR